MTNIYLGYADIARKGTLTASPTAEAGYSETNVCVGPRRKYWRSGTSQATHTLTWDLGAGVTSAPDKIFLANTKLLLGPDSTTGIDIQKSNDATTWYSLLYETPLSSAKLTGSADADYLSDLNTTLENRLLYSENWANSAWNKAMYPVSISGTTITATAGTSQHAITTTSATKTGGIAYRTTVDISYNNYRWAMLACAGDPAWHCVVIDLQNGSLGTQTNCSATISTISTGRYRVAMSWTASDAYTLTTWVSFATATNNTSPPSWTATGSEKIDLNSIQYCKASTPATYVATASAAALAEASTARYFRAIFQNVAAGNIQPALSKIMLCKAFDFGRDPFWGRNSRREITLKGQRQAAWVFELEWHGITDAKIQEYFTEIGDFADVQPIVIFSSTYDAMLHNLDAVHMKIESQRAKYSSVNSWDLYLTLEECV